MINLVRGDEKNLVGRVISFARLDDEEIKSKIGEMPIISIYSTTNVLEFIRKLKIPPEAAEELKNAEKKTYDEMKHKGINIKLFSSYVAPLPEISEESLKSGTEDLVDTGSYLSPERCIDAAQTGIEIYTLLLEKQFLIRSGKNKIPNQQPSLKDIENYSLLKKDSLKRYLREKFILPIFNSRKQKDENKANYLSQELKKFCENSPFTSDIDDLVEILRANRNVTPSLIEDYLCKIEAINLEKYEIAAIYRDRILKNSK